MKTSLAIDNKIIRKTIMLILTYQCNLNCVFGGMDLTVLHNDSSNLNISACSVSHAGRCLGNCFSTYADRCKGNKILLK